MHEQCCIDWRAAQEPLIYPPRMIALRIPPRAVVEVNGPARNARVSDAERHEHECSERRINIGFGCLFDQAPNQKIARVRIRPGLPRAEEKRIKTYARQKLGVRPWHVAALDGRKIFGPSGIAAQATRMLEQLTQCVGSITQRNVEREATARNEHKRTGSEAGLADTPPWHGRRIDRGFEDALFGAVDDQWFALKHGRCPSGSSANAGPYSPQSAIDRAVRIAR